MSRTRTTSESTVDACCAYDLAGGKRPRFDRDAIVSDAVNTFFGDAVVPALESLQVPAHLIWATAGKHDTARPMYTEAVVEQWAARLPTLTTERVVANHVTVMFDPAVIKALG